MDMVDSRFRRGANLSSVRTWLGRGSWTLWQTHAGHHTVATPHQVGVPARRPPWSAPRSFFHDSSILPRPQVESPNSTLEYEAGDFDEARSDDNVEDEELRESEVEEVD